MIVMEVCYAASMFTDFLVVWFRRERVAGDVHVCRRRIRSVVSAAGPFAAPLAWAIIEIDGLMTFMGAALVAVAGTDGVEA